MNHSNYYFDQINNELNNVRAAKEVVCSITTGFRLVPSIRSSTWG
ncbi:hypothetical protein ACOI1C_22080 [Bacillus sp. DJP31]